MSNVFKLTGGLKPRKSLFDLSYRKTLTCDMGQLIPIVMDEVVPGDLFELANEIVVRFQPLVAPILHEINVYTHYYFVPYRLLWDDWEEFITGGIDGQSEAVLPRWNPTTTLEGTIWDYMGFPVGVIPTGALPIDFPRRAYNFIYNNYYRDENLQAEVALSNEVILNRAWEKDYFTSSLPWQQRGIAPALPVSGLTSAVWTTNPTLGWPDPDPNSTHFMAYKQGTNAPDVATRDVLQSGVVNLNGINNNTVDLSNATTFNVADIRLAFQIQKWMERNARAGVRYTEFLKAHYGVAPRDERLQRPEYIGGSKSPVIISEVLQTSSTDDTTTPQGNMAGHGLSADRSYIAKYHAQEFGVIVGIMSIMPRTSYMQGVDRQWLRRSRFDFYSPEFANLSEQAIERAELYCTNVEAENTTVFGFQGRYDEMRYKRSLICGAMRGTFDYWHLGRKWNSAPLLNAAFIKCEPSKRIFAVQNEPGLIVNVGNNIRALRPLPIMSNPGFIDHN